MGRLKEILYSSFIWNHFNLNVRKEHFIYILHLQAGAVGNMEGWGIQSGH